MARFGRSYPITRVIHSKAAVSSSVSKSDSDTGVETEAQSTTATLSFGDTGTGVEATSIAATMTWTDVAAGTDTQSIAAALSGTDTGSSAETQSTTATLPGTDTGAGTEATTIAATLATSDTGAGTEAQTIAVAISGSDTASATEAQSIVPITPASGTDTGSGASAQSVSAALSASDTAAGTESQTLAVTLSSADTGTLVDGQTVSGGTTPSSTDSSSGTSNQTLAVSLSSIDTHSASESWSIFQINPAPAPPVETLLMGPATVYLATFGAVEPANGLVGSIPDSAVWTDLGGILGGVELVIDQEWQTVDFVQMPDTPFRRLKKRRLSVKTQLAELTLANLAIALNDTAAVTSGAGYQAYNPSDLSRASVLPYQALIIQGWHPGFQDPSRQHKRRSIIIRKALSQDNVTFGYSKDGQSTYTVTWDCYYVDASTAPFRIVDQA